MGNEDFDYMTSYLIALIRVLWHILLWKQNESQNNVEHVYPLKAEFTRPLWIFGINSYDFVKDWGSNNIVCTYRCVEEPLFWMAVYFISYHWLLLIFLCCIDALFFLKFRKNGRSYLGILDHTQSSFTLLDIPFTDIYNVVSSEHCFLSFLKLFQNFRE